MILEELLYELHIKRQVILDYKQIINTLETWNGNKFGVDFYKQCLVNVEFSSVDLMKKFVTNLQLEEALSET